MFQLLSLSAILSNLPWLLLAFVIFNALSHKSKPGLRNVPGPQLAAITDLWRFLVTLGRRSEVTHQELHAKYGDAVRLGPNMVSISDLKAVKEVYGFNTAYIKSDYYPVQRSVANGKALESIFNTTDNTFHAKVRKGISPIYATSTIVQYEPLVDITISSFLHQLDERYVGKAGDTGACDFGEWLHYFAFDVIGEMLFKQSIGFVDNGTDVEGIISSVGAVMSYISVVGTMPWLDKVLLKNPIRIWMSANGIGQKVAPMAAFASKRMAQRLSDNDSGKVPEKKSRLPPDILDRLLLLKEKDPALFDDKLVFGLMVGNVFGGSDSTAITMRTIFYHLLKSPRTLTALLKELDAVNYSRDDGIATWNETRQLPYLTAVIQEALRLHPAAGFPLERIVPASGLQVGKYFLPAGTVVGASAWVLHQKEEVFGPNCQEWRPERWLEASVQQRKEMNNAMFAFSMGSKECLGKGIAYLEIYKLIPTILRKYKLSLAYPEKEWKLRNAFFVEQTDFYVRLQRRGVGKE